MVRTAVTCPDCGRTWDDPSARFCGACGARLDAVDPRIERESALVDYVSRRARGQPAASPHGRPPHRPPHHRDGGGDDAPRRLRVAAGGTAFALALIFVAWGLGSLDDRRDEIVVPTPAPTGQAEPIPGPTATPTSLAASLRCSRSNRLIADCEEWTTEFDGPIDRWVSGPDVLVADVSVRSSTLAIDLATGNIRWERVHTASDGLFPDYVAGGLVIGRQDERTVAIGLDRGEILWRVEDCPVFGPESGDLDDLVLTSPCWTGGVLTARGLEDGVERWSVPGFTSGFVGSTRSGDLVLVEAPGDGSAALMRVDAATGRIEWRDEVAAGDDAPLPTIIPHPAGDGVVVFQIDVGGPEVLLDVREVDHGIRWQRRVPARPESVTVLGNLVVVEGRDGTLTAFELRDGSPRWSVPQNPGLAMVAAPLPAHWVGELDADVPLVMLEDGGRMVRRSRGTGQPLWVSNQAPSSALAWLREDLVIVTDGWSSEHLVVLDVRTGRERLTVELHGMTVLQTSPLLLGGPDGGLVRIADDVLR